MSGILHEVAEIYQRQKWQIFPVAAIDRVGNCW